MTPLEGGDKQATFVNNEASRIPYQVAIYFTIFHLFPVL